MHVKYSYKKFKVVTMVTKNNSVVMDELYDNLKYREALVKFKEVRQRLDVTANTEVKLLLIGTTTDNYDNTVREKFFTSNVVKNSSKDNSVDEQLIDVVREEEVLTDDESYIDDIPFSEPLPEMDGTDEIDEMDYLKYLSSEDDSSDFVSIGDLLSDLKISLNSHSFGEDIKEGSTDENNSEERFDSSNNIDDIVIPTEVTEVVSAKQEFKEDLPEKSIIPKTICSDYSDNAPGVSNEQTLNDVSVEDVSSSSLKNELKVAEVKKSIRDINLFDHFNHISEVEPVDIVKLLIDILTILDLKHTHLADLSSLITKKRDCVNHDFENLKIEEFTSETTLNSYMISLGHKLHQYGVQRRKAKNDYALISKVFSDIVKVKPSAKQTIEALNVKQKTEFDASSAPNIKVHTYKYKNETERKLLMIRLPLIFDKVVDVCWGTIECYNNVGSTKARKLSKNGLDSDIAKVAILDGVSSKGYESLVDEIVPYGNSFLKTKGSSVKLTNVGEKGVIGLIGTIQRKYEEIAYDSNSKSIYLINRLD